MGLTLFKKIISTHLAEGEMISGSEIGVRIDQTLTQDATGTMAYLEFEAMGIPRVKTELSVSYVDHNTLQTGFENADDHRFLQDIAAKYGLVFSRPGNGICHQVHLERFGVPGKTLLGSDSHTPTGGGIGMVAIGAGGLDVALAMAGKPFHMIMPEIIKVNLIGRLIPMVSAKDIILELLRRLSVKDGVNRVFEYAGDGVKTLSIPERATITNMGAELGATTSIFPSDEVTYEFLKAQGRERDFVELQADDDALYDGVIEINLSSLEPLVAKPHSPDNVVRVKDIEGLKIDQVFIGSCTNSSLRDLMMVAEILKGKTIAPNVSLSIAPGSKQVYEMIAENGTLKKLVASGARMLESACGPCVGMGQVPPSGGISLRTSNRNFEGRSGTKDAQVYLVSAETAAVSAIKGVLTDPRVLNERIEIRLPQKFNINDNMIILPPPEGTQAEVRRGPNIKPLPEFKPLPDEIEGEVLIKVGDNITTDHIMPAGAKVLPYRSNLPKISEFVFERVDPTFAGRAQQKGGGFIVGGANYGQGSSREHAALAPYYLGIRVVIAKSFARIHRQNLINFGILPLIFDDEKDYEDIEQGDILRAVNLISQLDNEIISIENVSKGRTYKLRHDLSDRQIQMVKKGGALKY
ncbi:MAG: aconitate hydratase [Thermoanaerobacteraceae bacterium]|nr:aconitate hydratase [Thermoanaerobacteraceae bacterium]